jgi:asparagine synthetase B (glutamine-hydrolysing)
MKIFSNNSNVTMARLAPESHPEKPVIYSSGDGSLHLSMDGYVITRRTQATSGIGVQVDSLVESFQGKGISRGLEDIVAGSYVMTIVDAPAQKAYVITDPIGSLPAYIAKVERGWLVSTNPVALARTGLVDLRLDMTACAEWALFGYALGERYPVKGVRTIAAGTILSLDLLTGRVDRERFERLWENPIGEKSPSIERTAEAFQQACARLRMIDPRPANLQSAGMDSRLITASWPEGFDPPCYTYGDPDAHEIRIARMVAEKRGSRWSHTWQHGDEVADNADSIFQESGIIMWPDRRFAAAKIAADHHSGVLDGLCGDVMLGGSYYGHDNYFGWVNTIQRLFARPYDLKYSQFSMDHIVEAIFRDISQVKDPGYFEKILNDDSLSSIQREKPNVLQDIWECIRTARPGLDSMALLWRNFLLATRASHYTAQQGVTCRNYTNVYYPFTNDRDFARTAMSIRPRDSMYRRYYLRLYRRHHPRYAEIPYGDTLIPIRRPVLNHKLSTILLSKGLSIPHLTGSPRGRVRDPNGWSIWLAESGKLREYVRSCLVSGGLSDKSRADVYFREIASGKVRGRGKLFHLASIAKWTTIPSGGFRYE